MTPDRREPPPSADFDWHPEPELVWFADEARSRPALRRLGEAAWAEALDYLYGEAFRRAFGEPVGYRDLRREFFGPSEAPAPAPTSPSPAADVLAEFRRRLAPHGLSAYHRGSLSYFTPPPLPMSVVGELLAQVSQQGVDVWHSAPVATLVEEEVVRWLRDLVGHPPTGFGLLTSGGTMANFLGLALARDVQLRRLRGTDGPPRGAALERCRAYASDQAHFSVGRALDELGFPAGTLAIVPSDQRFRLDPGAVAGAVSADRAAGIIPFAVVAVAGSTNTGSVDDIPALADLARRERLWLHVDAAYGGAALLSPRDAGRVEGVGLGDSVTVDPHKWFFQAYDVGGLLVREGRLLEETFSRRPEYYRGGGTAARGHDASEPGALDGDGLVPGAHDDATHAPVDFYRLGFEGTRRWRALKLWMSWKHLGSDGLARLVERTDDLAAHLAARCRESDDLELAVDPPELSVVCFRHLPGGRAGSPAPGLDPAALDAHQDGLQAALEASGEGWLSTTRLRGATWLRAGVVNYLATADDVDALLEALRALARGLPAGRS